MARRARHISLWAAAFAVLAVLFVFDRPLYGFLEDVTLGGRVLSKHPFCAPLFDFFRTFGKWPMLVFTTGLLAALHPRGKRFAVLLVVSVVLTLGSAELIW